MESKPNPKFAKELFLKSIELDPRCSASYLQLGILVKRTNPKLACEYFQTCLDFDPENYRVLSASAILESENGNTRRALDLFERASSANPKDAATLQAYALYVAELGDLRAARALLRRATRVDPKHSPVWQAWGVMETRHGSPDAARKVFQQGVWSCAQSTGGQSGGYRCARLWQAWGVLEAKEGDLKSARQYFNRALDADRRNVAAVTAWALMEAQTGDVVTARQVFERGIREFSSPPSEAKLRLWDSYESMEWKAGNELEAAVIGERKTKDRLVKERRGIVLPSSHAGLRAPNSAAENTGSTEVLEWRKKKNPTLLKGEVWLADDGKHIETKIKSKKLKTGLEKEKEDGNEEGGRLCNTDND